MNVRETAADVREQAVTMMDKKARGNAGAQTEPETVQMDTEDEDETEENGEGAESKESQQPDDPLVVANQLVVE